MTPEQIKLVRDSWQHIEPMEEQVADYFYKTLFELDPSVRPLFKGDIKTQGKKLMEMMGTAVSLLNRNDTLLPIVMKLGERHRRYQVKATHYETVGSALLNTLQAGLGDAFTEDVEEAWTEVYGDLSATMIEAANNSTRPILHIV
ncbi:MAG: globin family protein [Pseudomonadales bacterium]